MEDIQNGSDLSQVSEGNQAEQAEQMLTQSHVNNIVRNQVDSAVARTRQELEAQFQQRLEAERANIAKEQQARGENVPREVDTDKIYQEVQERFARDMERKQLEDQMKNVAESYLSKMSQGAQLYEDFDKVTGQFDPGAFPQLVYLISGIDNAADVVYELAKNPMKLTALDNLAARAPGMAQSELQKLAASIKVNRDGQQDANQGIAPAPLDRLTPSRANNSNSDGNYSVNDFRAMDWLRG